MPLRCCSSPSWPRSACWARSCWLSSGGVPSASPAWFAFSIDGRGRVAAVNDAGAYGRHGMPRRDLLVIEQALARCGQWPVALRGRYVAVAVEGERQVVLQATRFR